MTNFPKSHFLATTITNVQWVCKVANRFIPVEESVARWRKDPEYVAAYDALEEEFALAKALIGARAQANLTQEVLAVRMGASQSAIPGWKAAG